MTWLYVSLLVLFLGFYVASPWIKRALYRRNYATMTAKKFLVHVEDLLKSGKEDLVPGYILGNAMWLARHAEEVHEPLQALYAKYPYPAKSKKEDSHK